MLLTDEYQKEKSHSLDSATLRVTSRLPQAPHMAAMERWLAVSLNSPSLADSCVQAGWGDGSRRQSEEQSHTEVTNRDALSSCTLFNLFKALLNFGKMYFLIKRESSNVLRAPDFPYAPSRNEPLFPGLPIPLTGKLGKEASMGGKREMCQIFLQEEILLNFVGK